MDGTWPRDYIKLRPDLKREWELSSLYDKKRVDESVANDRDGDDDIDAQQN
jgi:hypothetical protein